MSLRLATSYAALGQGQHVAATINFLEPWSTTCERFTQLTNGELKHSIPYTDGLVACGFTLYRFICP